MNDAAGPDRYARVDGNPRVDHSRFADDHTRADRNKRSERSRWVDLCGGIDNGGRMNAGFHVIRIKPRQRLCEVRARLQRFDDGLAFGGGEIGQRDQASSLRCGAGGKELRVTDERQLLRPGFLQQSRTRNLARRIAAQGQAKPLCQLTGS